MKQSHIINAIFSCFLISTISPAMAEKSALDKYKSSADLIQSLPASAWRSLSPDNTIVMSLPTGEVVIELAPDFAPNHVANIKTLVAEKYFDGTAVIRSQDNYVAQWGDTTDVSDSNPDSKPKSIGSAVEKVEVEFFRNKSDVPFNAIVSRDAYADEVGFTRGLPTSVTSKGAYLSHCYGMVGVSRGMPTDSGNGSGLYAITGHAPRHLDLNVTLVGKVWIGMEHLSSLPRGKGSLGFYTTAEKYVPIEAVEFLKPTRKIEVLKTNTPEFSRFVELRTTRNEDWFIESTGKIELCNVWVPVREI
ncbi:peptidylprolyl isomerase [Arenicella sp. 4NH20-0111]